MEIDLCKFLGVEEGETFKINDSCYIFKIMHNKLLIGSDKGECWLTYDYKINLLTTIGLNVIKLPKRKEFTDDELVIMRNVPKKYEWMARDNSGDLYVFHSYKPKKENGCWDNIGCYRKLALFQHLFNSITSEDEEPVFIGDYVER